MIRRIVFMFSQVGTIVVLSLGFALGAGRQSVGAVTTFYPDLASFSAAAGAPLLTQDFSAFAPGANLFGVDILPGFNVTTNMTSLTEFVGSMFGNGGRGSGMARYDMHLALPYTAIAFDIISFEADPDDASKAHDQGFLTVFYADATSEIRPISGNPFGNPIFVGLISNTPVTTILWAEAHEGSGGNEETALDNFRVVRTVPEPGCLGLAMLGVVMLRRRRPSV